MLQSLTTTQSPILSGTEIVCSLNTFVCPYKGIERVLLTIALIAYAAIPSLSVTANATDRLVRLAPKDVSKYLATFNVDTRFVNTANSVVCRCCIR